MTSHRFGSVRRVALLVVLLLGAVLLPAPARGVASAPPRQATPPEAVAPTLPTPIDRERALLVKKAVWVEDDDFEDLLVSLGLGEVSALRVEGWWRIALPEGVHTQASATLLGTVPQVSCVEEDRIVSVIPVPVADTEVGDAEPDMGVRPDFIPNDPLYSYQWGLSKVGAPSAWDLTRGSDEVVVVIIDSGIDDGHPDKPARLTLGWDYYDDDALPFDWNGHGTHVAGIAAARTGNSVGVAGLCPNCRVYVLRVLGPDGRGYTSDTVQAIKDAADWAVATNRRGVINLSLGSDSYSSIAAQAVAYAQSKGCLVVAAAGNDGPGSPGYPAALAGVIAVAATRDSDQPTSFSQYGDLAAPGYQVLSTIPRWYASYPYDSWSGTSMASPLVAAAAGLVWSLNPALSAQQVANILMVSSDLPSGWNSAYGVGRLNVYRALLLAQPVTRTPTPTIGPGSSPWAADADFTLTHGAYSWYYQYLDGSTYRSMVSDGTKWTVPGAPNCALVAWGGTPSTYPVVRKWVSPISGWVRVTGVAAKANTSCGDGVTARILKNAQVLWSRELAYNDAVGQQFDLTVAVSPGDAIYFFLEQRGNDACDATYFHPYITQVGPPKVTPTVTRTRTPTRAATRALTPTRTATPAPRANGRLYLPLIPSGYKPYTRFVWRSEAEAGAFKAPMRSYLDPSAYCGRHVSTHTGNQGSVTYSFRVPSNGDYYLWARVRGVDWTHNSFTVSLGGRQGEHYEVPQFGGQWVYGWDRVHPVNQPVTPYRLTAGTQALVFAGREPYAELDAVLVTDDPGYVPPNEPPAICPAMASTLTPG